MKHQRGQTALIVLMNVVSIALFLTAAYGWGMNIVKLVALVDAPATGMIVLRAVGILVAPLGVVLGFC